MARKKSREERDALLEKIKADFDDRLATIAADPHAWVTFIEQVAVFGARYSLHNQILLIAQAEERGIQPRFFLPFGNKDGTSGWKREGRHVRKGEKAFLIWAPIRRRPTEEQAQNWEAEGRTVARDPSGRPAVQVVGFRLSPTFELDQTDGQPFQVPTIEQARRVKAIGGRTAELLTGDDPTGAFDDVVGLIEDAGYTFSLAAPGSRHLRDANGVTVAGPGLRLVLVRDDVSTVQRLKSSLHELAHIRCGHLDNAPGGVALHRGRQETEAESVAHIVCRALGVDTRAYSDAYVINWADGDLDLVQACAQTVLRVAKQILADLTPDTDESEQDAADGSDDGGAVDSRPLAA